MVRRAAIAILSGLVLISASSTAVFAADRSLALTIGGRPISRTEPVALFHDGVAYVSANELVRSYGGITSQTSGATAITLGSHAAVFTPGSSIGQVDGARLTMPAAAFVSGGSLYVPLTFFVTQVAGGSVRIDSAAGTADITLAPTPTPTP